ncbi:hypothetical protein LAZ67_8001703 [Cordylochernes scorpioides]|uniref:Uncharacterized protein n=1 Tax=Cordylochernes scorpioides TaxID=51811 RepID=A0ABY6KQF8_9ARAC|nr:hypothetical protein LAZ67_8001703 [Cordylochernes scorpioides]
MVQAMIIMDMIIMKEVDTLLGLLNYLVTKNEPCGPILVFLEDWLQVRLMSRQLELYPHGKQEQNRRQKLIEPSRIFQEVHQQQSDLLRQQRLLGVHHVASFFFFLSFFLPDCLQFVALHSRQSLEQQLEALRKMADEGRCKIILTHHAMAVGLETQMGGPSPTSKSFRQEINTIEVRTSLDLTDNTAATLCFKEATKKMYQKLLDSPDLEINPILQSPPKHRLKSRKPIWSRGNQLLSQNFNISEAWTNSWISSDIPNKNLITPSPDPRTGQGRCAELMKLWGYTKDPNCACNVPQSMSHILDDCPLYKFNGGISNLHSVTPEALNWLKALPLRL